MFKPFPKITRYTRPRLGHITEKMDGTNACVIVEGGQVVGAQSRNRLLTSLSHNSFGEPFFQDHGENHGFAHWVKTNKDKLALLGDGYHYGEWCGPGINGNRHNLTEKVFYHFNPFRYRDTDFKEYEAGISFVRVLFEGEITDEVVKRTAEAHWDSIHDVFYKPEGVMIYYHDFKTTLKFTYDNPEGKWSATHVH